MLRQQVALQLIYQIRDSIALAPGQHDFLAVGMVKEALHRVEVDSFSVV